MATVILLVGRDPECGAAWRKGLPSCLALAGHAAVRKVLVGLMWRTSDRPAGRLRVLVTALVQGAWCCIM
jgi:hypothetical protein